MVAAAASTSEQITDFTKTAAVKQMQDRRKQDAQLALFKTELACSHDNSATAVVAAAMDSLMTQQAQVHAVERLLMESVAVKVGVRVLPLPAIIVVVLVLLAAVVNVRLCEYVFASAHVLRCIRS